jgi:hypothetical protein
MQTVNLPDRNSETYNYWFQNIEDFRWNNYNRTEFEVSRDALTWKKEEFMNWINNGMPLNNIVSGIHLIGYTDRDRDVSLSLPEQIINLPNLTFIGIENSGLTTLPNSIGQLTHLKILDIKDSNLNILPESIGQLTNLLSLKLINTKLTTLPQSIGQLSSLYELNIKGSPIKVLPPSIGQLNNLDVLNIINTKITKLPEELMNITGHRVTVKFIGTPLSNVVDNPRNFNKLKTFPANFKFIPSVRNVTYVQPEEEDILTEAIPQETYVPPTVAPAVPQGPPRETLKTKQASINPQETALDVIMSDEDTVANFIKNKYKIFIVKTNSNLIYYAVNGEILLDQLNKDNNIYYKCNQNLIKSDPHTLMSTTLITGLQGFVYIEDFTNAINSSNNYFMLEQKDENKNIMAMPKRGVCTDARAGLYDITIIEPSFASSSSSSSSSEQINVDDSEPKRRKLNNEGTDFGGGKKRKTRKTKTRKTKKTKTRKTKRRYH